MIKVRKAFLLLMIFMTVFFAFCLSPLLSLSSENHQEKLANNSDKFLVEFQLIFNLVENNQLDDALLHFESTYHLWRKSFNKVDDFVPVGNANFYPFPKTIQLYDSIFSKIYSATIELNAEKTRQNQISHLLFLAGRSKFYIRNFDDALNYLKESKNNLQSRTHNDSVLLLNTVEAIGDVYEEVRNYEVAVSYYIHSEELIKNIYGSNSHRMATIYEKFGGCFIHMCDEKGTTITWGIQLLEKGLFYLSKSKGLNLTIGNKTAAAVNTFQLGLVNYYLFNRTNEIAFEKRALKQTREAIKLLKELDPENPKMGNCYLVLKQHKYWEKQTDSMFFYLRKIYSTHLKNRGKHHQMSIMAAQDLSSFHYKEGRVDSAVFFSQKALEFSHPGYNSNNLYELPDFNYSMDYFMGTSNISFKIRNLAKFAAENIDLNAVTHLVELIEKFEEFLIENPEPAFGLKYFAHSGSYYTFLKEASACYMTLHEAFPDRQYDETAFHYLEKLKQYQFLANVNHEKIKVVAGIPQNYIDAEREIHNQLIGLKNTFINNLISGAYQDYKMAFEIQKKYQSLADSLEKIVSYYHEAFPQFDNMINNVNEITITQIQQSLDKRTAVLDYFYVNNYIQVFVIKQQDVKIYQTGEYSIQMRSVINDLRQSVVEEADPGTNAEKNFETFTNISHALYKKLFTAELKDYLSGIDHLIVLPESDLFLVPFDALITKKAPDVDMDYSKLSYLAQDYSISTLYSASMLFDQDNTTGIENPSYAGYAPWYNDHLLAVLDDKDIRPYTRSLGELVANRDEVIDVSGFFDDAKTFLNEMATEYAYKINANKFDILHFAMHAVVDEINPLSSMLIFDVKNKEHKQEDNLLNLYEIYQTPTDASLVVLSACNSGTGSHFQSEGMISLSRAFINAGAQSVVSTHWWAHDETTKSIMVDFFNEVNSGLSLDKALHNSKLNFLENAGPVYSNPYYWANFILVGDSQPLIKKDRFTGKNFMLIIVIVSLISIVGIALITRNRRRKAESQTI